MSIGVRYNERSGAIMGIDENAECSHRTRAIVRPCRCRRQVSKQGINTLYK